MGIESEVILSTENGEVFFCHIKYIPSIDKQLRNSAIQDPLAE